MHTQLQGAALTILLTFSRRLATSCSSWLAKEARKQALAADLVSAPAKP